MSTVYVGSVLEGTVNPYDLLGVLSDELELCGWRPDLVESANALYRVVEMLKEYGVGDPGGLDELVFLVVDELFEALNECAPPYLYFGAHPDDGASIGWWVSWDSVEEADDVLRVSELSEVPAEYDGLVLANDTMYRVKGGEVELEVWKIA